MAEDQKNKVISKKNSGFPEWLNFDKLRSDSLEYLGKLSGKIWTDHNVHDPGITILEMLCYALLDLGYRTSLPPEDLFTKNPDDSSPENNFFTPSQILTCNPLTITDYRKLLIDIPGVNNAWLKVAEPYKADNIYIVDKEINPCNIFTNTAESNLTCLQFLNGLYHVYIDFEDDPDEEERKIIVDRIKGALMAHRNLCEDFIQLTFLCKQKVGVCADIELEIDADAEQVYKEIVENLRNFFSPSPKFYTLQQLLDKNKSIEEIFAGRPYDIKESHGFVDVEEFENIKLLKEIHVSDVYHEIFNVKGVRTVRNLSVRNCDASLCIDDDSKANPYWKFKLYENHIPDFSLDCSEFQFTKHGNKVSVDTKKFVQYFKVKFSLSGKVLYENPSPYLDAEIPKGIYRSDLAEYYSIQNEFPRVYGIGEGGLSDNAPDVRKAQALQLKGYLLFFDQFLANYLMQLKGIRDILSLSAPALKEQKNTYFINQLTNVPDLDKLLRFKNNGEGINALGKDGSILALPVKKKYLEDLIKSEELKKKDVENDFQPYPFITASECDIAIDQLREDLINGDFSSVQIANNDDCWFFYLFTSSEDIALISNRYYKNEIEARTAATSVMYIGMYKENYRSYGSPSAGTFLFDIEMNMAGYLKYLQFIVEDGNLYVKRRQQFLDHLLARFAERFTDYALLSFGFSDEHKLAESAIAAKEKFLSYYPDLSSNRGKAYDYKINNWNNDNISGLEKRFKAFCGMDDWRRKNLCNFEVVRYDELFFINLSIGDYELLSSVNKFDSASEAYQVLLSLLDAVANRQNYSTHHFSFDKASRLQTKNGNEFSTYDKVYHVQVKAGDEVFVHPQNFSTFDEAEEAKDELFTLFSLVPTKSNIEISSYQHFLQLNDVDGNGLLKRNEPITTEAEDIPITDDLLKDINLSGRWQPTSGPLPLMHLKNDPDHPQNFIDLYAFKINIFPSDLKKDAVKYKYSIYDLERTFLFHSENEFDSEDSAISDCHRVLFLLTDISNYYVVKDDNGYQYRIQIRDYRTIYAIDSVEYSSPAETHNAAEDIHRSVNLHKYLLQVTSKPNEWKTYKFILGFPGREKFIFNSVQKNFENSDEGWKEVNELTAVNSGSGYSITRNNNVLEINAASHEVIARCQLPDQYPEATQDALAIANSFFDLKKRIDDLLLGTRYEEDLKKYIIPEGSNLGGDYAYRLVKRDACYAYHILENNFDKQKERQTKRIFFDKAAAGYDILDISLGIDEVNNKKTKDTWYHYQVKYHKRFYNNTELVLFESVIGYASRDEAEKAFNENLWTILTKALDKANYGPFIGLNGPFISLNEKFIQEDDYCAQNNVLVFIPQNTLASFGNSIDHVINYIRSYPIRSIKKSSREYIQYFDCETSPVVNGQKKQDCKQIDTEKDLFYFVLFDKQTYADDWISCTCYDSSQEAMQHFNFFLLLLRYEGNYHIDYNDCDCTWRLYLREILAESSSRFKSEAEAWGEDGVEKFICVSQSENAFHANLLNDSGCYSFYIACGITGLIHPCKYDNLKDRDETIEKLYNLSKDEGHLKFITKLFNEVFSKEFLDKEFLNSNADNFPGDKYPFCHDIVFEIIEAVLNGGEVGQDYEKLFVKIKNNSEVKDLNTTANGITFGEWREKLNSFAYYFPFIKREGDYFVEIRFPEFCKEDFTDDNPCSNQNKKPPGKSCCCVAWKSECCFRTCEDASHYYFEILKCLSDYSKYISVFDCECGPYGIELHCDCPAGYKQVSTDADAYSAPTCCNEIIAVNPQCYTTPKMDCEAIERAKKLINCEGLHLVEHILLRPHCEPDDCKCVLKPCKDSIQGLNDCTFEWKVISEDVCAEDFDKTICFIPGGDPYSFIATVVLPAWPARFRKQENRALVETILYREAPAHVLLRILWLSPHDLFDFEKDCKQWNRWLADKKICDESFSVCNFLNLLFNKPYHKFKDCDVCLPCKEDTLVIDPCFKVDITKEEINFPDEINKLFCWNGLEPPSIIITSPKKIEEAPSSVIVSPEKIEEAPSAVVISTGEIAEPSTEIIKPGEQTILSPEEAAISVERKKFLRIQSRYNFYKKNITDVLSANPENTAAGNALIFLQKLAPQPKQYETLIMDIINAPDKTKESTGLNKTDKKTLIRNLTWRYLDTVCFDGRDLQKIIALEEIFKQLRDSKINMNLLFQDWKSEEIKEFEPDIDFSVIKKYLTGN